ncbi:type II secretion system major pseudopilin GspG [Lentisphaerota bacterium WC36G]|nr:type II secretion system major pseudopilin GspG [Lentisphaerae bacterium WC36]
MKLNDLRGKRSLKRFTLIEVIVVIVIIALLATIAAPNFMKWIKRAKITTATAQIKALQQAVESYEFDNGSIPDANTGLSALITNPGDSETWDGPYLKVKKLPLDPWGAEYIYAVPGEDGSKFSIKSLGSDKSEGGSGEAADIISE